MTKISRLLTLAGLTGMLLTGAAFAQSTSTGAMSSSDHMTQGSMSSMTHGHDKMSSGAMTSGDHMKMKHMKASHMKMSKHGKKESHHKTSGTMTSSH